MASKNDIQQVLANWIARAMDGPGQLADGVEPAQWVARNFLHWWQTDIEGDVADADRAIAAARAELIALGGWKNSQLVEALQELTHASEAIGSLRSTLGVEADPA
jgi:hypothetical protein